MARRFARSGSSPAAFSSSSRCSRTNPAGNPILSSFSGCMSRDSGARRGLKMVCNSYGGRLHEEIGAHCHEIWLRLCGKLESGFQQRFTTSFMMTEFLLATMMDGQAKIGALNKTLVAANEKNNGTWTNISHRDVVCGFRKRTSSIKNNCLQDWGGMAVDKGYTYRWATHRSAAQWILRTRGSQSER